MVYSVIDVEVQRLIQPRFTVDAVGISPTVAFLSLIFWAFMLGGLGALLAISATMFSSRCCSTAPRQPTG